ncbi:hypothetical protein [Legionella rowbothamii]|uniref:hypothetical protein n=1 Tax=Legionella rowbothamii TaxID=96229 RepID=UPI001054DAC4|nr:hypothetical protein [Legionella rowbothamii]
MLEDLLFNNEYYLERIEEHFDYLRETWNRMRGKRAIKEYQGLKFLRGFEARVASDVDAVDPVNPSDPNIVLHNLQALADLFRIILYKRGLNKHVDCPPIKDKLLEELLNDNVALAKWQRAEISREVLLTDLFDLLNAVDSRLTVGDFFTATNVQFNRNEDSLSFKLTLSNGSTTEIVLKLDKRTSRSAYVYREDSGLSFSELFNDLISGIRRDELSEQLRNLPLSFFVNYGNYSYSETRKLLSYHRGYSVGEQLKKQRDSSEQLYLFEDEAPISLKIYQTFKHLRALAEFVAPLSEELEIENRRTHLTDLTWELSNMLPAFEGYLKGVAVRELKAILDNQDLDDNEAVKKVEEQLKRGVTLELLMKNRQSKQESDLKFLSIISIFIGIGIFTTLALVFKRLYDSGGKSINFFKPLSQNLYETIEQITSELEDDPEPSNSSILL